MDEQLLAAVDTGAIDRIAAEHYGGLEQLFVKHGWPERGKHMMTAVNQRVIESYGSIAFFEARHAEPALPDPLQVIEREEPDVWLTSFYGFTPENWGYLGFTKVGLRDRFIRESRRGALVAIYGARGAAPEERARVLGLLQMSRKIGDAREFMSPREWNAKQADRGRRDKWNFGIKAVRAWRITPETRPTIQHFAPNSYTPERGQSIGSQCTRLTADEARGILSLDLQEVSVFGQIAVERALPGGARSVLSPSRSGPVSQSGYMVKEAEGPKHIYILRLSGNADHFMGEDVDGQVVIKVGMSCSPSARCDNLNGAIPLKCAFRWEVERSTAKEGRSPFPSSAPALAGEQRMKDWLDHYATSLGGEFFLVDPAMIDRAWSRGIEAAETWTA